MITAGIAIQVAFLAAVALIWVMIVYQVVMTAAGFIHRHKSARRTAELLAEGGDLPPVSILIPARNEEVVIASTLETMRALRYPGGPLEIIVVDDGSTDRTAEIVGSIAAADPRVRLFRLPVQEQGRGKSHALNTALRSVTNDIIAVFDADNRPESDSLEILVRRLLADGRLAAVLGKFRTINRSRNLLTAFINLETLAFQWIVQAGRCRMFGVGILPGTNFVIRRGVLEACDGWDERAITEDTELSIRVHEMGWRIDFAPEAVSWEEEPERFRVWVKQRTRWVRGNFYILRKFLFSTWKFRNKFLAAQVIYLSVLYYLFLASVLISHLVFIACVSGWLRVDIPGPYTLVWLCAFVLFVAELFLVASYEAEHRLREVGIAALMYLTYCQAWLIVVVRALWHEYVLKEGSRWDKTVRFGTPTPVHGPAPAPVPAPTSPAAPVSPAAAAEHSRAALDGPPQGGGRKPGGAAPLRSPIVPLLLAGTLLLGGRARADSLLGVLAGEESILDAHWGEVYGEGIFKTREDNNLVGMLDVKDGFRLWWVGDAEFLLYGKARAFKDTRNEFWNNKALVGPGLRLKPFRELGLHLFAEYLFGAYYGLETRETPNPYDPTFHGVQAGAAFWQRWGELPAETSFFLPFTRWRELYWDAIYFQYIDDNFIATAQGREGFGAVAAGPILGDLYVRVDAMADTNGDYWNNFLEGSVGVRLRPDTETYDVKLSIEFVGGYFFDRGDGRYEIPFEREYIGARVELTFWFGWESQAHYNDEDRDEVEERGE